MAGEYYSYAYGFENSTHLNEANSEVLNEVFINRLRFVHEEYTKNGKCTPYLLDQMLLMDNLEAVEFDINLNPDQVIIQNLPHVREIRRADKIQERQNEITSRVEMVAEQIRPLIEPDSNIVTIRFTSPHRDGQTNADVYPRITGMLASVVHNGQQVAYSDSLSIPLIMIIQGGSHAVRFIQGEQRRKSAPPQSITPPSKFL